MGVRYLQPYILKTVHDGVKVINIIKEIEGYRRRNNGIKPLIVIHLSTLRGLLSQFGKEMLFGGRYNKFNERLNLFLKTLVDSGSIIVFFYQGSIRSYKLEKRLVKKNQNYRRSLKAFDIIDEDLTKYNLKKCQLSRIPPFAANIIALAEKYGKVYRCELNECNLELGEYAHSHNALAVISDDTDFLIYEGNWRFWSSKIDIKNFTTNEFNRQALRRHLSLNNNQMPVLATLCGNDFIRHTDVEIFLQRMEYQNDRFVKLAQIVKQLRTMPPKLCLKDVKYLSRLIHPPERVQEGIDKIYLSLNYYNYRTLKRKHEIYIIDKIKYQKNHRFNYIVLQGCPFPITIGGFDLRNATCLNCMDLILNLIRRNMGILLQHLNDKSIKRIFYYKKAHNTPYERFEIEATFPNVKIPPLADLLLIPHGRNMELDKLRIELICWQISTRITPDIIKKIPEEYLIDVLTIFYLYENHQITLKEADWFLLANCDKQLNPDSLNLGNIKKIDNRLSRIAFLFPVMYINICQCFFAVGLTEINTLIKFDGLYFHTLSEKWDELGEDGQNEYLKGVQHLRIYSDKFGILGKEVS